MTVKPRKVVIIGAGHVGSHVGSSLILSDMAVIFIFIVIH